MDTLYITTEEGEKIQDQELLKQLEEEFSTLVARHETPG
jgi:hypothetical protein